MHIFFVLLLSIIGAMANTAVSSTPYTMSSVVPARYSDFKTIQTEHFDIHYPSKSKEDFFIVKNMEMIARMSAVYLEEGFEKLTQDLNSTPYLRIQVVIVDNTDSHNGFASPVPQNTIYIYAIPPLSHTSIAEYDNWLRDTVFHELTHIVNLSTTRGYSVPLRTIFGTVVSINGLSPLNLIEGYTVFEETNMTKKGRGRSTFLHTMMRTTAYEKTLNTESLYSLSIAPYVIDRWPTGNVPYLYGYLLMEHVAKKYGMDIPGKISKHNAGVIPYFPSISFNKFTGKEIPELWDDMLEEKRKFYANWIDTITKDTPTKIESKTNEGFINRTPTVSPDGKYLAYYVSDPNRSNRISILDLTTNKEINHIKADDASFIKWLDQKTIIFNKKHSEVGSDYYKTIIFDVLENTSRSIPKSERLLYASVINKNELCTVRARTGRMDVSIENIDNNHLTGQKTVYSSQYLSRISNPVCIKTDNTYEVYFIEKNIDKKEQIIKIDSKGKRSILHETNGSIKGFVLNKDSLIFIDDPDSIFNLYRLDLSSNKTKKITNLISGAFDVENSNLNKDEKIYITYYTSNGFRIGTVSIEEQTKELDAFNLNNLPIKEANKITVPPMQKKTYYGFKTLVPKLWIPSFAFVDGGYTIGGMTYGSDALFRHQYFASAAYDSRTSKPLLGAVYVNQAFYPTYSISAYNDNTWYSDDEIIQELFSNIDVAIPINTYWVILTGLTYNYRTLDFIDERTKRMGLYGGIGFSDTDTTLSAISKPEEGVSGYLKYSIYPKGMSTYSEYEIDSNLKFYIPMWWNGHVIAINNDLSYTYGNPYMFFVAGGEQSSLILSSKKYLMRGYPVSYFATQSLIISNLEYRFPIFTINSGHDLFPLFIKKIHGAITSDHGFMGKNFKHDFHSYGVELRTDTQILYHLPVTLRLGLYKGTNYAKGQFFIGVSTIF